MNGSDHSPEVTAVKIYIKNVSIKKKKKLLLLFLDVYSTILCEDCFNFEKKMTFRHNKHMPETGARLTNPCALFLAYVSVCSSFWHTFLPLSLGSEA